MTQPVNELELRAMEQRNQLHQRANELRTKISETREKLDVTRNAREHFGPAAAVAAGVAFITGYGVAKAFFHR